MKGSTRVRSCAMMAAVTALLLATASALGHGDGHQHVRGGPWWAMWNLRIEVLACLAAMSWGYWLGLKRLWGSAGIGRGVSRRQAWAFAAGIGALVLALVTPIDVIAEELNWVHMVQHMLLIKVAAPLLVLGSTLTVLLWAFPAGVRRRFGGWTLRFRRWRLHGYVLWQPILMWASFALVLWLLHLPRLYSAALHDRLLHDLQHVAFLVSACLFWRVLVDPINRLRMNPGLAVIYLFTTTLHAGALGAFMAFSPYLWYDDYAHTTAAWGLAPMEDQQLAGYIMWMPACIVYAVAAAVIVGLWLREPQRAPRPPGSSSGGVVGRPDAARDAVVD